MMMWDLDFVLGLLVAPFWDPFGWPRWSVGSTNRLGDTPVV